MLHKNDKIRFMRQKRNIYIYTKNIYINRIIQMHHLYNNIFIYTYKYAILMDFLRDRLNGSGGVDLDFRQ